jgi:hypothetical protein
MKKALSIILLSLIIAGTFGFVILKYSAQGTENSFFNQKLRSDFARSPALRQIFGLHFDGDGRSDYLGPRYKKIVIEVDLMEGLEASNLGLEMLRQKVESVTGKPTQVKVSEVALPFVPTVRKEQIARLAADHRDLSEAQDTASVYLLFASQFEGEEKLLGLTYQEFGIVVFERALEKFAEVNQDTLPYYQESTALHEFGHQLGLPHGTEGKCLMNERAESNLVARQRPQDVVIDFCQSEKEQIQKTIEQLNNQAI